MLKRRGILAAAGAVVAGIVAKQVAEGVAAYAAGSIPFGDGVGGLTEDSANLSWDNANKKFSVGSGTSQYVFNSYSGRMAEIRDSTAGGPIIDAGPTLKVSRTENLTGIANKFDNEANAAIYGVSLNVATSRQQLAGVMGGAKTGSDFKADAVGLYGLGVVTNSPSGPNVKQSIGTGIYAEGHRRIASGIGYALAGEFRATNESTAHGTYTTGGLPNVTGLWTTIGSTGGKQAAAGKSLIAIRGTISGTQSPDHTYKARFSLLVDGVIEDSGTMVITPDLGTAKPVDGQPQAPVFGYFNLTSKKARSAFSSAVSASSSRISTLQKTPTRASTARGRSKEAPVSTRGGRVAGAGSTSLRPARNTSSWTAT